MKKQLGDSNILRNWIKGFEYCEIGFNKPPNSLVYLACTSTGRVSNLRIQNLDFYAPFPNAICSLTELNSLEIYNWTGLHGQIPSCISKLVNLRSLVITKTSISGSLPSFSKNTNLIGITLSNNHLSGTIPPSLSTLPNLHLLDLSSNYLCGEIPKGGNMGQFNAANFANNTCLCGNPLPTCFNSAHTSAPAPAPVSTTMFDSAPVPAPVSITIFESTPAPEMAPDSNSEFLSPRDLDTEILLLQMKKQLGDPGFLGNWVIDAICGFTELEYLEIYHLPGLHGLIPSCISKLVNLQILLITNTSLSGSVPGFSNNTNLNVIFLRNNHLNGTIPPSLSTLPPNLSSLDLSSNYLCGEIPQGGNMWKFNAANFANNACLCGNPLPPCFNLAPAPSP
ncbi:uncharacterized protein LOC144543928 [Carex rostrata]